MVTPAELIRCVCGSDGIKVPVPEVRASDWAAGSPSNKTPTPRLWRDLKRKWTENVRRGPSPSQPDTAGEDLQRRMVCNRGDITPKKTERMLNVK